MRRAAAGASLLGVIALGAVALAAGCGAPTVAPPGRGEPRAAARAPLAEPALSSPARYVLTDRMGALFDEAGAGSRAPRVEPAIVAGVRVMLDGGVIVGAARFSESIAGFRSVPKRFGSGYVIWSDARTYRAADFLGELEPIVDVAAAGGARPWLGALLLRTERGVLELDPASLAVRRSAVPGLADAFALDAKRAVRLDGLGRAQITLDSGVVWTDVLATRGIITARLEQVDDGSLALVAPNGRPELRVKLEGDVVAVPAPIPALSSQPQYNSYGRSPRPVASTFEPPKYGPQPLADRVVELQGTSRTLPSEVLTHAAFAGALLPGDQLLVARDGGLRAIAAHSGRPVADGDLLDVAEPMRRCQPARVGSDILLACTHDRGSHVMVIDGALDKPKLEATFPVTSGFVAGPRGRFGFVGRCGAEPPSAADFKPVASASSESGPGFGGPDVPPAEPPSPEGNRKDSAAADDDARFCARVAPGQWVERRVRGRDARRLYRWIPGLDGSVTALVIDAPGGPESADPTLRKRRTGERDPAARAALAAPAAGASAAAEATKTDGPAAGKPRPRRSAEGVRVIHLDPSAASLKGAMFPAASPLMRDLPYRVIDADFWQDDDGALRGWVVLPAPGEEGEAPPEPPPSDTGAPDTTTVKLPVSAKLGGRAAGVTLAADGGVTLHALPDDVIEVVRGGRFAIALAEKDDVTTMHESLDGGRTWRPIQSPPVGRVAAPYDSAAIHGCTEVGCTWGEGIVRLGWGGPPPVPLSAPAELTPAVNPLVKGPDPIALSCEIAGDRGALTAPAGPDGPRKPPPGAPGKAGAGSAPPVITLRTRPSSSLGTFRSTPGRGGSWSADVILPFRPGASAKKVSLSDPSLTPVFGSVAPLLRSPKAGGGDAVDLVLLADRRRLPLGASSSRLLPFDYVGAISTMTEDADGGLYALDADKGVLLYARGDAGRPLVRLTRIADVQRVRLTLGVRSDGRGPAIVGVSTSSGEVFVGALDPARAEVGPLEALGNLASLRDGGAAECRARRPTHRFLADIPVALALTGGDRKRIDDGVSVTATALIDADRERLCLQGLEVRLSQSQGQAELTASFGSRPGAVLRAGSRSTRASCTIQGP
jgi:hypothetical protein